MPVQFRPGGGGGDTALAPDDELLFEDVFKCGQLLAQCGLGNVEQVSRTGNAAKINDFYKSLQSPYIQLELHEFYGLGALLH